MGEWRYSYFVLAVGLCFAWIVFFAWSVRRESGPKQKEACPWWSYLLFWPWTLLLDRNPRGPRRNGKVFTWREFMMGLLLLLIMIGAVVIDKIFPASSRSLSP